MNELIFKKVPLSFKRLRAKRLKLDYTFKRRHL